MGSYKRVLRQSASARAESKGPEKLMEPDLVNALWQSYLPLTSDTPTKRRSGKVARPKRDPLSILEKNQAAVSKPLLGIAVWNQVRAYRGAPDSAPPALNRLLASVLDLDVGKALRLQQERPDDFFPPAPDQMIYASRYESHEDPAGCKATVEICVPADFDSVKAVVDPKEWPNYSFSWARTNGKGAQGKYTIEAQLALPNVKPTTVTMKAKFSSDGLTAGVEFEVTKSAVLKVCHGHITVKKERARPGAVRIVSQRVVQFVPEELKEHAAETLKYWLETETVSLVIRP